ncbi:uncharacterized protein BDZ99DRAFT_445314, partial [Mytilinidion resinicola]
MVLSLAYLLFENTVGLKIHEWQQARKPRRQPRYEPLLLEHEIRLLIIEPGKGEEKISCELRHVCLTDGPQFEALSYVWGDSREQRDIICGGSEVDIGINLFEALEGLRLPDRERVLWIDALGINQADIKERTHQVLQIGDVYSTAQRVLIWLGKETDANRGAFKMILSESSTLLISGQIRTEPIAELLRHSWFRRIWVTQELASARS